MDYQIRAATTADLNAIIELLPRLADFSIPANRKPEHLWHGDADIVREWAAGKKENTDISVACAANKVIGVTVVSARKELLSAEPSAHLEVLALDKSAEGFGIGAALIRESERLAKARGALSITLHVFSSNTRALALYERSGFDPELIRCIKPLA